VANPPRVMGPLHPPIVMYGCAKLMKYEYIAAYIDDPYRPNPHHRRNPRKQESLQQPDPPGSGRDFSRRRWRLTMVSKRLLPRRHGAYEKTPETRASFSPLEKNDHPMSRPSWKSRPGRHYRTGHWCSSGLLHWSLRYSLRQL
jgi:hypothetical protein